MTWNSTALAILIILTNTRTKNHGTCQSDPSTYRVNHRATSKVMEDSTECIHHKATVGSIHQPSSAPCPVTLDGINHQTDKEGVNHIHGKLCSFCHCTGHDGR